jgi:hypothetical protein
MNRRIKIWFVSVLSFISVAGLLCCLGFLAAWDWSLTTAEVTVFVNAVEAVDGAVCTWPGSQQFDVTLDAVNAQFGIMQFKSERVLTVLIEAKDAEELQAESINVQLVYQHADGTSEQIHIVPKGAALVIHAANGKVTRWSRHFQITEDMEELPEGSIRLLWSMDYRDANGEVKNLSITVPLRREEITSPSSIIRLERNPRRSMAVVRLRRGHYVIRAS